MKLLSNILKVLSSSIITFSSNFIIGFILPLYLSIAEYGYYREFILYFNYFYILNLGFNEGLYIKYGGKSLKEIDTDQLQKEHNTTILIQFIICSILLVIGVIMNSSMIIVFSIAVFFSNVAYFHQLVQQALSEFSEYSRSNTIKGISTILTMLIALILFQGRTHTYYIVALLVAQVILFIYCEYHFYSTMKNRVRSFSTAAHTKIVFRIGIFMLAANFLRVLVGSIGQWLVKVFTDIEGFAQYSLAGSMLSVVLLVINSVAAVFYTVISRNKDTAKLVAIKNLLLLFGIFSGLAYFVLYYVIGYLLPDYIPSLEYMKYLILCVPYLMVINVIATNLYKTQVNEKKYFLNMLSMLILTIGVIAVLFIIFENPVVAAIGTTLVYIIWYYIMTMRTFPFLKNNIRYNLLLLSHFVVYLVCGSILTNFTGMIVYVLYCFVAIIICKQDIYSILSYLKQKK